MKSRRSPLPAASLLALCLASPALAQYGSSYASVKGMDERFRLDLGGFFQKFDTMLRLDSPSLGAGTTVNLEPDLGLPTHATSFRADGYLRFGRHGRVEFGFLTFSRSAAHTITKDIEFGDHVYHAGVTTDSKLRLTQADLYYSYSFVNTGEAEVGLMLGVSALFNSASLTATGFVTGPGGTATVGVASESRNLVAPIPAVGAQLRFTLLPGFLISARARGLPKVTISGNSGSMVDVKAALDFYLTRNIGIGGGYSYSKIIYERLTGDTARLDYTYSGPLAYLTLAF